MKNKTIYGIGILLIFLIISMPFCFASEMALTYDANGNLVTGDGFYRTYNSLNQLWKVYNGTNTSILLEEFTYHPVEERVFIKEVYNSTGSIIETTYYINQNYVQVINLSGTFNFTYYYVQGTLVAQDMNGIKSFFANDQKGNVVTIMNSTGSVVDNISYGPFGDILSSGNKSRLGYEGKEQDKTTQQTDFNARMLKGPQFIQPDPLISNVYDPQSLNRYGFERENPYGHTDQTGHTVQEFYFNGGTSLYTIIQGYRVSTGYANLADQSFKEGNYKSGAQYYATALKINAEAIIDAITIFIGGTDSVYSSNDENAVDDNDVITLLKKSTAITPTTKDYQKIDEHFQILKNELKKEEEKLTAQYSSKSEKSGSSSMTKNSYIVYNPKYITSSNPSGKVKRENLASGGFRDTPCSQTGCS